jgi:hypothetical protein
LPQLRSRLRTPQDHSGQRNVFGIGTFRFAALPSIDTITDEASAVEQLGLRSRLVGSDVRDLQIGRSLCI